MASARYCANCLTTFVDDVAGCPNLGCRSDRPDQGWGLLLGEGDLLDRTYRVTRALAVGGAGLTYLAREVDDQGHPKPPDLAIKVLYSARATGNFLQRLANEAQILQKLDHEHIVKCHGFVQRSGREPYLVTQFEHGGSLQEHLERHGALTVEASAHVVLQILGALDVAHQRGVVHRDLKPDNILLRAKCRRDEVPHCLVTDFGIAKVEGGLNTKLTKLGAFVGTPEYAAPEQFEAKAPTPATDVFAAGGVLFHCLMGRPPVRFSNRADIERAYEELLDSIPPRLNLDHMHAATLQTCIDHMMDADPEKRWTISQVTRQLRVVLQLEPPPLPGTMEVTGKPAPKRVIQPAGALSASEAATYPVDEVPRNVDAPRELIQEIIRRNTPQPLQERTRAPEPPGAYSPVPTNLDSREKAMETPRGGGGGCLGLSMVAILFAGVGGGVLVGLAWAGAAYGFGWFSPVETPVAKLPEVVVALPPPPLLPKKGAGAWFGDWKGMNDHLRGVGGNLGKTCSTSGLVAGELRVAKDGTVTEATLDPGWLGNGVDCVRGELTKLKLPRAGDGPARLRFALRVGD